MLHIKTDGNIQKKIKRIIVLYVKVGEEKEEQNEERDVKKELENVVENHEKEDGNYKIKY